MVVSPFKVKKKKKIKLLSYAFPNFIGYIFTVIYRKFKWIKKLLKSLLQNFRTNGLVLYISAFPNEK